MIQKKILNFFENSCKMRHITSFSCLDLNDLCEAGFYTTISLHKLTTADLDSLHVSPYDKKKFLKLQLFIKQVMSTIKTSQPTQTKSRTEIEQPATHRSVVSVRSGSRSARGPERDIRSTAPVMTKTNPTTTTTTTTTKPARNSKFNSSISNSCQNFSSSSRQSLSVARHAKANPAALPTSVQKWVMRLIDKLFNHHYH